MTDGNRPSDGSTAVDTAVSRAELAMARRVDSRFEQSVRTGQFAAMIVMYVIMGIVGVWLRTLLVPRGWEVAAACGFVAVLAWAVPWLSWLFGRKPPAWVAAAETCEEALKGQIPDRTMTVVSEAINRIRWRPRRQWHGVNVYLSRCSRSGPPDTGACRNAGVLPTNGRLIVVIGEHMATVSPQITAAVLAHESRHTYSGRMYLSYLVMLSRLVGWVIIGWAVPWPALLPAVLAFHIAATLLSWAIEVSCDLGGAAEVGPDAMLAALNHISQTIAQDNRDRSGSARYTRTVLMWAAGPIHPPLPLRRAIVSLRWPQASAVDEA
jgi:Zn-dependent protease with chaperone function